MPSVGDMQPPCCAHQGRRRRDRGQFEEGPFGGPLEATHDGILKGMAYQVQDKEHEQEEWNRGHIRGPSQMEPTCLSDPREHPRGAPEPDSKSEEAQPDALPDVGVPPVAHLVGHDGCRHRVGVVMLEQGAVEDNPLRGHEAGEIRVLGGGPATGVAHVDLVHGEPGPLREGEDPLAKYRILEGADRVEEGINDEGREVDQDGDGQTARAPGPQGPAARGAPPEGRQEHARRHGQRPGEKSVVGLSSCELRRSEIGRHL